MSSMRLFLRWGVGVVALVLGASGNAVAEDAPRKASDTGQALDTGGALAPIGGAVDTSQGGVAGTGLGKLPPGSGEGKGMSVKGPAGQGIQPMQTPK